MSAHLARAQLLMAQSRPADAERELMLALASRPDDPAALALLALSRSEQRKGPEALAAAESAIGLAILVVFYRNRGSIAVEDANMMKG